MCGKGLGEVRAKPHKNFAEKQQSQAEQRDRNDGRNTEVGRLAEAAIRLVMPAGVRVRHDLEQKEERNQGERKGGTRS